MLVRQVRRVFRGTSHHTYIWSLYKRIRRRFHPYSDTSLSAAAMYLARSMTSQALEMDIENGLGMVNLARARLLMASVL